jgi:hypothetical protein
MRRLEMKMGLNLTEKQLKLAQWLAQQWHAGNLPETFTVKWELENYVPETGEIIEIEGEQPEISYASLAVLEKAGLILTAHKQETPAQKSGTKKVGGSEVYQFGWPRHETSRTYTLLGSIFQIASDAAPMSGQSVHQASTPKHDTSGSNFVDPLLIEQLQRIANKGFDLSRLIRYCEEINDNFGSENYSSVIFLARAILDHCPPIFGQTSFDAVAAHYGGSSFKSVAQRLNTSLKKIADHHIHKQIGKKEVLPVPEEINFSNDLNFLLARIIEKLEG